MKQNFESLVLPFTLRYEGGKVDDPRDPGGRTNQGVTQATFDRYRKAKGQPSADVFEMSGAERTAIYHDEFWDAIDGDRLPSGVDLACFDFAVNSGPARALASFKQVGGPAKAGSTAVATVKALCAARLSFLRGLRTFGTFGRGWTARVAACEALGVKMALQDRTGQPADAASSASVATVLRSEAGAANRKAEAHRRMARGAGVAGSAAVATTPMLVAAHGSALAWTTTGVVGAGLVATALALWRRSRQHQARATAYAAAAA